MTNRPSVTKCHLRIQEGLSKDTASDHSCSRSGPVAMHDTRRPISRRSAALLMVGGLVGVVLSGPALAASPKQAAHAAKPSLVGGWAAALEQRALEIQSAPKAPATRIGYGAVVKKGDGGMIESVAPAVDVPPPDIQAQAPTLPGLAPVEPAPPVVFTVRSPLADRVGKVARRLTELGYLPADKWADSFNDDVDAAVRAFQLSEGLQPDGKVGEVTRQALDRTPAQTVALLRRAAAAMRAQQASIPETTVLVNLPGQSVTLIEHGRPTFTMRAVVGRPSRKTPLLQDKITSVTINPTWTVPPTVLSEGQAAGPAQEGHHRHQERRRLSGRVGGRHPVGQLVGGRSGPHPHRPEAGRRQRAGPLPLQPDQRRRHLPARHQRSQAVQPRPARRQLRLRPAGGCPLDGGDAAGRRPADAGLDRPAARHRRGPRRSGCRPRSRCASSIGTPRSTPPASCASIPTSTRIRPRWPPRRPRRQAPMVRAIRHRP